ncbi:MAG: aldo/keto reductase [Pseudobdellovibrionaceae bacterium]|jgi:2,5-diketo-D-gluconate reductase B|nr:aldo/keto reductase [Pseudobdellovibrionaceae bacterium]
MIAQTQTTLTRGAIRIPRIGLGTWQMQGITCEEAVTKAFEIGYRHIDTAQIYENEAEVGNAIAQSGLRRSEIFLTTKIWIDNVAAGVAQKSVEESLRKLKTDYVDLLLLHWPVKSIPLHKQIRALQTIQDWGMAKTIGISNYPTALLQQIIDDTDAEIVCNQVEYHPFLNQDPILDFVRKHNMYVTAYCPLARGLVRTNPAILQIAGHHEKSAGQVALRWLIQQDNVVAIPKAANPLHIQDNFNIFDFELSADEMAAISALANPEGRIVKPEWGPAWDEDRSAAKAA